MLLRLRIARGRQDPAPKDNQRRDSCNLTSSPLYGAKIGHTFHRGRYGILRSNFGDRSSNSQNLKTCHHASFSILSYGQRRSGIGSSQLWRPLGTTNSHSAV